MGPARNPLVSATRAMGAVATCALLSACAASLLDGGPSAALFKSPIGDIGGGVAPGPHSVWYVQNQPVAYVKMGFATWQPQRTHGVRAWFARHFGQRPAANSMTESSGVVSTNLQLPVPSRVQVTNLASGQVITVRVDDKASMGDAILKLTPEAARGLGADPAKPLLIRMRYLGPMVAYNGRPALRYAFRRAPAAVLPVTTTALAIQAKPAPQPRPEIIKVAETRLATPLPILRAMQPAPRIAPTTLPPAGAGFRVQAGAFASLANAHHAVNMLEPAGAAIIEPMQRGAVTLYRVIVPGPKDAAAAERLRTRVAEIGFADARLIHPL